MKPLLVVFFVYFFLIVGSYLFPAQKKYRTFVTKHSAPIAEGNFATQRLRQKAALVRQFALQNGLSNHYAFLIDMGLPSGKKRFFVYDFIKDKSVCVGLVAHGSCNTDFLQEPNFSDKPQCGCTAIGRYKVGYSYEGRFGKAFKLYGLDNSNRNAFERNIVLHSYNDVPDNETYPQPIVNSLGCPMVSPNFLNNISRILKSEKKPVLLWIYQ